MATESGNGCKRATWDPVAGGSGISPGGAERYAETKAHYRAGVADRRRHRGGRLSPHHYGMGCRASPDKGVHLVADALGVPDRWEESRLVSVSPRSDLFDEAVPPPFVRRVFDAMNRCSRHTFLVLTEQSARLAELSPGLPWASNIWVGVTVRCRDFCFRIEHLRNTGAAVKLLSLEPLLGPLDDLDLSGIDWVIVGGDSGPGARPMRPEWVVGIRDQCLSTGVPFFFKQWGGRNGKKKGRMLEGRTWDEMPHIPAQ